ncbi:unnamed protein product [Didymodactylos carnosus]|uniref:Uncharacterized protein n=1 Tax=Didymodactylos carnosus TaxID=1234261 RepID=A0A8S2XPC7_9BILA|nr:unnamed protein product [Didymodactylos carnosus]
MNFKFSVAKLTTINDYYLIEILIQNLTTLKHLSLYIGYLNEYINDISQRFEQYLLPKNLIQFNFYLRFRYSESTSFIMPPNFVNNNEYWRNKLNCNIICFRDINYRYCHLCTWPFVFNKNNVDCVSSGIDDLQTNFNHLQLSQVSVQLD